METLQIRTQNPHFTTLSMNPIIAKFRVNVSSSFTQFRYICASSLNLNHVNEPVQGPRSKESLSKDRVRVKVGVSEAQFKEKWLASLSYPFPDRADTLSSEADVPSCDLDCEWVIGIDPDLSGALALLKTDDFGCSAQVFASLYNFLSPWSCMIVSFTTNRCLTLLTCKYWLAKEFDDV